MFEQQAIRLLREQWPNPTMLAEELFAILSNEKLPLYHEGPVTLAKGDDAQPGLSLPGFNEGDTAISISGDTYNITIGGDGLNMGGLPITNAGGSPSQGANGFYGTVVSGTGNRYRVRLNTGAIVFVTQGQIDSGETIPVGTFALVTKASGNFFMQVPVFL